MISSISSWRKTLLTSNWRRNPPLVMAADICTADMVGFIYEYESSKTLRASGRKRCACFRQASLQGAKRWVLIFISIVWTPCYRNDFDLRTWARTVLLTLRSATRRLTRVVEAIRFPASEQQFEDVVTESYTAETDQGGTAIANGSGEVTVNGESELHENNWEKKEVWRRNGLRKMPSL